MSRVRQEWGCDKCTFRYHSPAILKELTHHCPPNNVGKKTAPAKLLDIPKPVENRPVGRVLKRRSGRVA